MRRVALAIVILVAVVAGGLAVAGRGPFGSGDPNASPTATIGPVPAPDSVVADGELVPVRSAELGVTAGGRVTEVAAEGARVAAGDVVLRLDPAQADAAVSAARAAIPVAEAQAAQAVAAVGEARQSATAARYQRDQARATWNAARATRDQLPSGASSAQKRAADANVAAARAAYRAADAQRRSAGLAVSAAGAAATAAAAEVDQAKAALAQAVAARAQLDMTAPIAGVVAFAGPSVGEAVTPGSVAIRIADPAGWRVRTTDLDETAVARIRAGSPAVITLDAFPGVSFQGVVGEIGAFGEERQGDIVYRVLVEPSTALPPAARWGMTASVTISAR